MKILSLFDGLGGAFLALKRAGIDIEKYYRSEIDPYSNQVASFRIPESINLGDVRLVKHFAGILGEIDILIAGSPCQGFSYAGRMLNFEDPRSKLFFEFYEILKLFEPKYFLLENVNMKQEFQDVISDLLGVQPIKINSNLLSAQNRPRLYWTNIPGVKQPRDKRVYLSSVTLGRYFLTTENLTHSKKAIDYMNRTVKGGRNHWDFGHHSDVRNDKSAAVVANFFKGVPYNVLKDWGSIRKFHPIECERLQTIPDNWTKVPHFKNKNKEISNTQRYKMLGNSFTVEVITHILNHIKM